ncbi:MAG TPA: hypothetical protein VI094_08500, partial [Propionibacteriaceae bacterium]
LGWLRTVAPRYAPDEITGALISAPNGVGQGLSIQMLTIHQRPFPPEGRWSQPGHWGGGSHHR